MILENICNETTVCICCKCRCKNPFERNFGGTAGDIVHFGYGKVFKTKEEIDQEKKDAKEKLRMNPPINFNDKRKKKEWEK